MLQWNSVTDHKVYNDERTALLTLLEGSTKQPYVDGVGDATIGIGFNLVYNLEPVLRVIIGDKTWSDTLYHLLEAVIDKSYAAGQSATLIANLNQVMKDWHDHVDKDVPGTFSFRNDAQIARALDAMDDYYDGRIDSWVAGIPESSERAALFSLTWNAPGLLGPKLKAAIESGDRAEAWYEIRYNSLSSSLPENVKPGIANRRYVEAETFSLYHDVARATYAEAVDAGRMLAAHHTTLLAYEAKYDPLTAAIVKGVDTIDAIGSELQPAISAILRKYGLPTDRAVEELLATGNGRLDISGDGTGFDSINNDDDLLLADKAINRLFGDAGNDILIGLRGADTLAGGAGADLFVFTAIKDSAAFGKADVITDFDAADQIAFSSSGVDFVFLTHSNDAFSDMAGEIRWQWSGQKTLVEADYDGDGVADLRIALKGMVSLNEGDFLL